MHEKKNMIYVVEKCCEFNWIFMKFCFLWLFESFCFAANRNLLFTVHASRYFKANKRIHTFIMLLVCFVSCTCSSFVFIDSTENISFERISLENHKSSRNISGARRSIERVKTRQSIHSFVIVYSANK